jgi:chromosome segregation ATPase
LKERNSKLNELIIKHEQSISLTTTELHRVKDKCNELETKMHSTVVERDMLKSNYERLTKEHELLIQENSSRVSILSNLEVIRSNFERNERETKSMLTQKIEQLERDLLIQTKQIEQAKDQHSIIVKSWETQNERLNQQLDKRNTEYDELRTQFSEVKTKHDELQEKYNEAEAKLHSHDLLVQMSRNSKSSSTISRLTLMEEETKEMQSKLSLADKEIVSLKIQLEDSKSHAKQYKNIADTMEKTIREASEANEKTKEVLNTRIAELNDQLADLQTQNTSLINEKEELDAKFKIEKQDLQESINMLELDKEQLTSELDLWKKKHENLESILQQRTLNRDETAANIVVLEEKCKDLSELNSQLDRDLNLRNSELSELKQTLIVKEADLERERNLQQETRASFESSEALLKENCEKLRNENENLIKQIDLLQQELSKLGQDLLVLQKQDSFKLSACKSFE